jgi:hypothetical protein
MFKICYWSVAKHGSLEDLSRDREKFLDVFWMKQIPKENNILGVFWFKSFFVDDDNA